MPSWLVIGISGVTCGGKTTLAHILRDYFQPQRGAPLWNTPYIIGDVQLMSQDDYFLPVDDLRHKWNDKLNAINFELLSSLDMKQMLSDITWMMKGRYLATDPMENIDYINEMSMSTSFEHYAPPPPPPTAVTHHYNQNHYQKHSNLPSRYSQGQQQQQQPHHHQHHHHTHQHQHPQSNQHQINPPGAVHPAHIMRVNSQLAAHLRDNKINILIIEGFIIFNQPELLTLCNIKFHLHLPYEKCFERRSKRTYDPPDVTGYFEICVWPQYEKNFSDIRDRQDITFLNGDLNKDRIFKFVLQKIAIYFEERCDLACPPPQKLLGIPSCVMSAGGVGSSGGGGVGVGGSIGINLGVGVGVGIGSGNSGSGVVVDNGVLGGALTKTCPMEQQ